VLTNVLVINITITVIYCQPYYEPEQPGIIVNKNWDKK